MRYDSAFTFIYSKRTGTPAAALTEQIPEDVVKERFDRLLTEVQQISAERTGRFEGQTLDVLVEEKNSQHDGYMTGRLSCGAVVHFPGDESLIGQIIPVKLEEPKDSITWGREDRRMGQLSPMMQEYMKTKEQYKDCILFYRLGDFYEMFFEDAILVSKELELTLTGKDCGLEERAPMCGVPHHAVEMYLNKLVNKGYKVAIGEQVEDPKTAKGLVRREVTVWLLPDEF